MRWGLLVIGVACAVGVVTGIELHGGTWSFTLIAALLWGSLLGLGGATAMSWWRGGTLSRALSSVGLAALVVYWSSYWLRPIQYLVGSVEQWVHAWLVT